MEWSRELRSRDDLTEALLAGIRRVEAASTAGSELTPFMSRTLDSPGFNDPLLNHHAIHHFHLGAPSPSPGRLVGRSDELLFALATPADLYFVDVFDHASWAELRIAEIVQANWPHLAGRTRLVGSLGVEHPDLTQSDLNMLQAANINVIRQLPDGTIHVPLGLGSTLSGVGIPVMRESSRVYRALERIQDWLTERGRSTDGLRIRLALPTRRTLQLIVETDGTVICEAGL